MFRGILLLCLTVGVHLGATAGVQKDDISQVCNEAPVFTLKCDKPWKIYYYDQKTNACRSRTMCPPSERVGNAFATKSGCEKICLSEVQDVEDTEEPVDGEEAPSQEVVETNALGQVKASGDDPEEEEEEEDAETNALGQIKAADNDGGADEKDVEVNPLGQVKANNNENDDAEVNPLGQVKANDIENDDAEVNPLGQVKANDNGDVDDEKNDVAVNELGQVKDNIAIPKPPVFIDKDNLPQVYEPRPEDLRTVPPGYEIIVEPPELWQSAEKRADELLKAKELANEDNGNAEVNSVGQVKAGDDGNDDTKVNDIGQVKAVDEAPNEDDDKAEVNSVGQVKVVDEGNDDTKVNSVGQIKATDDENDAAADTKVNSIGQVKAVAEAPNEEDDDTKVNSIGQVKAVDDRIDDDDDTKVNSVGQVKADDDEPDIGKVTDVSESSDGVVNTALRILLSRRCLPRRTVSFKVTSFQQVPANRLITAAFQIAMKFNDGREDSVTCDVRVEKTVKKEIVSVSAYRFEIITTSNAVTATCKDKQQPSAVEKSGTETSKSARMLPSSSPVLEDSEPKSARSTGYSALCQLSRDPGYRCVGHQSAAKYGFNKFTGNCEQFTYNGCGGNGNRFNTYSECSTRCGHYGKSTYPTYPHYPGYGYPSATCTQPKQYGNCGNYLSRYWYNQYTGKCEHFYYRGCNGNSNNFYSYSQCQSTCMHYRNYPYNPYYPYYHK